MKILFSILVLTVLCGVGYTYPDRRGICLTFCGSFSKHRCPDGYECRSNGCGHECYRPVDFVAKEGCTMPTCDNQSHCPVGYKVDKNGCDTCECDYSALHSYAHVG